MKRLGASAAVLAWLMLLGVLTGAPAFAWHGPGIQALTINPVTPTTVYAAAEPATVFKSGDSGANWSRTALTAMGHVPAVAIDPLTPTALYVATDSGVLKSTDGGATWGATGMTNGVSLLAIDPVTTIYAVTSAGLFKSLNGGATWEAVDVVLEFTSLAVDPVTPATVYVGTQRRYFAGTSGVWKSTDAGVTWSGGTDSWPYGTITVLAIDPVTPTTLYAGANRDYLCPECESDLYPDLFLVEVPGGALKSTDGGVSWQAIGLTNVHTFSGLAVHPMTTTTVYAATNLGLFKSTDGGTSWQATGLSSTNVRAVAIDPVAPSTVYVGTESGVFKSVDGGETWSLVLDPAQEPMPEPADTAPPDTSILSAADGSGAALSEGATTLSRSLTLRFTGADNVGLARFECRLGGAGFSTCTSPLTYSGLGVGRHTFEARAIDTSSNVDSSPARYTWTVDAPPDTAITAAIDGRGKTVANGGTTSSNAITFRFTGTDNETVAGFECRLDAGSFAACTSPVTYPGVSRGKHTFHVRAIDNKGFKDPSPASFQWTR
jgi:photosystem II stability/assembly factor-like uncharacterized protein